MDDTKDRLLRKGDYIHGSFLKPEAVDGYINGVNPGDRSDVLGRFPFSESSVDEAVDCAAIGARAWRRIDVIDRVAAVHRFRDHIARFQERLARLITRECGKPIWESRQEVLATIRALDLYVDKAPPMLAPRLIEDIGARSDRLPRGVAGILCPYPFPLLIPAVQSASALLAGNAAVVKPSKFTPGVGQAVAELWDRCKLPRGVYNMVQGPGVVVGQRIALHPGIDVLSFTGSYTTAATIRQTTLGRHELPVVMQTGGKGVAIVLDDAELDRAVYEVMVGAFLTAGQRHNSTGRVIVTEAIYDAFVDRLVARARAIDIGYGFKSDSFMGPLISENMRARYKRFARQLAARGHRPLLEAAPDPAARRGFYARPAIYEVDWENGHPFLGDEPPGPMILIYKVRGWREAAALHNQAVFRLASALFTQLDNPELDQVRDRLRTGALNINRGTIGASLRLPSIGLGRSSNGVAAGLGLLHSFTHARAQLVESRPFGGMPVLPGTRWEAGPEEPEPQVEDTEEDDLSASLELTS